MDVIAEIRRRHLVEKETISSLAIAFKLSRPTIRKHLKTVEEPAYQRQHQPHPMLGSFHEQLHTWLEQEADLPRNRIEQLATAAFSIQPSSVQILDLIQKTISQILRRI